MTSRLLRVLYAFEFLIALIAIFTAWSEIGGQGALDLMNWGWKLGLSFGLAAAIVAYTAALLAQDSIWTLRTARWLAIIIVLLAVIGIVSYYYAMQVDTGEPDDNNTISMLAPWGVCPPFVS